jgi:hypothetical protein
MRRLGRTYPCPVHNTPAQRLGGRRYYDADYACSFEHQFNVWRRFWPKGDSYFWAGTDDPAISEAIVVFQARRTERRDERMHELTGRWPKRAVLLVNQVDAGSALIPEHALIVEPQLSRLESYRAAIRAGFFSDNQGESTPSC